MTDNLLERNKQNVVAFYDLMFNQCKPAEAIERYAGEVYIQHNPGVGDGKSAFIAYFTERHFVVLHCFQHWPGDHDRAGMDIFRLDDEERIVEHWDVLEIVPQRSANNNTMF